MNILVINCGSSSLKFQLIDMEKNEVSAKGLVERIGIDNSRIKYEPTGKDEVEQITDIPDHTVAIELVLNSIIDKDHGVISSLDEISAIGHRVVHGGEEFNGSVLIDDAVIKAMEKCIDLAPLHNPANLMGIAACQKLMPNTPMVGVFDTAFHQTIDPVNYIYAIPYEYYEKHQIRRYGFHGTSHKYVTQRAAEILGKDVNEVNLITCHLGNGSSIAAIKNGKVIDTSMGLTPLEGLPMGTRCGNIDPAIVPFLGRKENMDYDAIDAMMNKKSGVLGVSGVSSDFRDLENASKEGNERAQLALDMFHNSVRKFIGSYFVQLDSVDAIIFTAGVGENGITSRAEICKGLKSLGIEMDDELNNVRGKDRIFSTENSSVKLMIIPTNEELMIAQDTLSLIK
ncbi:MAG: acetate kinase [Tissierellia bacterium]|nr:acetate kinase [Tissierellia bacterium]